MERIKQLPIFLQEVFLLFSPSSPSPPPSLRVSQMFGFILMKIFTNPQTTECLVLKYLEQNQTFFIRMWLKISTSHSFCFPFGQGFAILPMKTYELITSTIMYSFP